MRVRVIFFFGAVGESPVWVVVDGEVLVVGVLAEELLLEESVPMYTITRWCVGKWTLKVTWQVLMEAVCGVSQLGRETEFEFWCGLAGELRGTDDRIAPTRAGARRQELNPDKRHWLLTGTALHRRPLYAVITIGGLKSRKGY